LNIKNDIKKTYNKDSYVRTTGDAWLGSLNSIFFVFITIEPQYITLYSIAYRL